MNQGIYVQSNGVASERGASQVFYARAIPPQGFAAQRQPILDAPNLTPRQRCVLEKVSEGKSNKQIARELRISSETVKSHVAALLDRLGVRNGTQAAFMAMRWKLV